MELIIDCSKIPMVCSLLYMFSLPFRHGRILSWRGMRRNTGGFGVWGFHPVISGYLMLRSITRTYIHNTCQLEACLTKNSPYIMNIACMSIKRIPLFLSFFPPRIEANNIYVGSLCLTTGDLAMPSTAGNAGQRDNKWLTKWAITANWIIVPERWNT